VVTTVPRLRKALQGASPGLAVEREFWQTGHDVVVGLDEVGRGSWAGPLTVGAAIVPKDRRIYKLRDSKALTEFEREALFDRIADWVEGWAVGHASHQECDDLGMADAQRLASNRALTILGVEPARVLVDGNWDFVGRGTTTAIVRGDTSSLSIAAASILAKVTRDRMMRLATADYPYFAFDDNKGYPCPRHKSALQAWGPSAIHRRSWVFMDHIPWTGVPRGLRPDQQVSLFRGEAFEDVRFSLDRSASSS